MTGSSFRGIESINLGFTNPYTRDTVAYAIRQLEEGVLYCKTTGLPDAMS